MRRPRRPPPAVVAAADAAGIDPESLMVGDRAGRRAGYSGRAPGGTLGQTRRRSDVITGIPEFGDDGKVRRWWFATADLDRLRGPKPITPEPSWVAPEELDGAVAPSEVAEAATTRDAVGDLLGQPGGPVSRVEHELELELARSQERIAALEAERAQLLGEVARARRVAAALAAALAEVDLPSE